MPNKIQNTGTTTSSLTANATELTCGSFPLNMASQKITGLLAGVAGTDAVNLTQVQSLLPTAIISQIASGSNTALVNSSGVFRVFGGSGTDIINAVLSGSFVTVQADNHFFNTVGGNTQAQFTTTMCRMHKPLKVSTTNAAFTSCFHVDSSTQPMATALVTLNNSNAGIPTGLLMTNCNIEGANGGEILQGFGLVQAKVIQQTGGHLVCTAPFASSFDTLYSDSSQVIVNVSGSGGFSDSMFCQTGYITGRFRTYVPGSSREYKTNIQPLRSPGIGAVNLVTYQYDRSACEAREIPIADGQYDAVQKGFIYEDVPAAYRIDLTPTRVTVAYDELKTDMLQYHQERIRELSALNENLSHRLALLESIVAKLVQ